MRVYTVSRSARRGETLVSQAFPDLAMDVEEILGW